MPSGCGGVIALFWCFLVNTTRTRATIEGSIIGNSYERPNWSAPSHVFVNPKTLKTNGSDRVDIIAKTIRAAAMGMAFFFKKSIPEIKVKARAQTLTTPL